MKKFVFQSSSNDVNNVPSPPSKEELFNWDKSSDSIGKSQSRKEVSSPSLRRSVSLLCGSFYDSGSGKKNFRDPSRSPCHSQKVHPKKSGRDSSCRTGTPERQPPENFFQTCDTENDYLLGKHCSGASFRTHHYDPSESSFHCSSNVSSKVLDQYIDREQEQENSASANHYPTEDHIEIGYAGRQLPPRVHLTAPGSPVAERASTKEEARQLQAELDSQTRRLEREKNELQSALEKELDRRSSEWSLKLEKYQTEELRLRERVRELAEQNVSLQREVSSFNEKEVDNRSKISFSEKQLEDLSKRTEEISEENQNLRQQLSQLQEEYRVAQDDRDYVWENYKEKVKECEDQHRSIARLQRTCNEQEKTIDGLRGFCEDVGKKSPANYDNQLEKLQVEQIRLVGVERALRKELESSRIQIDSLRHENISLLNRLRGIGKEGGFSTFKLDQEICNRVFCLQNQGLNLLRESSQLCGKLLEYTKENVRQNGGIDGQFLIECNLKIQGLKRGIETLTSSLKTVSSVINEKSHPVNSDSQPSSRDDAFHQQNSQKPDEIKQSELKSVTLLTTVLRDKLYSKEMDIEQLQADLAAAVRGNDILKCEVQNVLDSLSCANHKIFDLELQVHLCSIKSRVFSVEFLHELQMIKKDENINQLTNELQECMKELCVVKGILPKVSEQRDLMWDEVKNLREMNVLLNTEINLLKKKVETLDEDILMKDGQITILKDSIGKPFDLLGILDST